MKTNRLINYFKFKFIVAILATCIFTSCDEDNDENDGNDEMIETNESAIELSNDGTLGSILVDGSGVTLYFFSTDHMGESTCLQGCLNAWPIFYAEEPEIGTGLSAEDFDEITHPNGSMQTTYKGWPLYYYSPTSDGSIEEPGATAGEGLGDVWFVAKPDYTIMVAQAQLVGNDGENYNSSYEIGVEATQYFVDAWGNTLYAFVNDFNDINNFTNSDFSNDDFWPIYSATLEEIPSILNEADFGTIDVFGVTQLTYKGWPLYYFGQDAERGENKGVSVPAPGVWPIVNTSTEIAPAMPEPTIALSTDASLGEILTDADGRTLYFFSRDVAGDIRCVSGCASNWPAFYTEDIVITDEGLSESDFENIEQDGMMITTYKGWPLYYYSPGGDGVAEDAGNTGGEGLGGIWYVMKPNYSLMIASAQLVGNDGINYLGDYTQGEGQTIYFTDALGRTLYTFINDTQNTNNFTASDFSNDGAWPVYHVEIDELPSDMSADDFGTIDVFGEPQLTFKGWPVYYFGGDASRGENKGVSVPSPGVWPIINNDVEAAQ